MPVCHLVIREQFQEAQKKSTKLDLTLLTEKDAGIGLKKEAWVLKKNVGAHQLVASRGFGANLRKCSFKRTSRNRKGTPTNDEL